MQKVNHEKTDSSDFMCKQKAASSCDDWTTIMNDRRMAEHLAAAEVMPSAADSCWVQIK